MIDKYLLWLNENPWLNIIFLLLAIFSIILSIYLYRISKKKRKPTFDKRSINVISDGIKKIGDVKVQFKEKPIDNLTVTKVAFWNNGKETINDADQAPTDKLRVVLDEEYEILESELIFETSHTNNIKLRNDRNVINIDFDYFDYNQGGILKFIHTGKKSSDVLLMGTFKGSERLKKFNSDILSQSMGLHITLPFFGVGKLNKKLRSLNNVFPWVILLSGIGLLIMAFYNKDDNGFIPALVFGFIYLFIGSILIYSKKSMPKGFEIFYDDE